MNATLIQSCYGNSVSVASSKLRDGKKALASSASLASHVHLAPCASEAVSSGNLALWASCSNATIKVLWVFSYGGPWFSTLQRGGVQRMWFDKKQR